MNRLCLSRRLLTGSLAVACAALAWAQGEVTSQDVSGNGMTNADTSATVYNITEGGALKFVAKANLNEKTIKVVPSETAGDYAVVFVAPDGNIQVPFENITSATFTGSGNLALVGQCGNGGQRQQINVSGCDQSSFSGRLYVANAWNKPCDTWLAGTAFAKAAFCFSDVYDGKNPAPGNKEGSDKLLLSDDASLAGLMSNRAQDSVEASTDESRTLTLAPNEACAYVGQMGSDARPLSLTLNGGTGSQTLSGTKTLQNLTINAGNLALSGTTEVRGTYTVTKTSGANVTLTGTLTLPESVTIAVTDPSYSGEAAAYTFEGVKLFTAGEGAMVTKHLPIKATVNEQQAAGEVVVNPDGSLRYLQEPIVFEMCKASELPKMVETVTADVLFVDGEIPSHAIEVLKTKSALEVSAMPSVNNAVWTVSEADDQGYVTWSLAPTLEAPDMNAAVVNMAFEGNLDGFSSAGGGASPEYKMSVPGCGKAILMNERGCPWYDTHKAVTRSGSWTMSFLFNPVKFNQDKGTADAKAVLCGFGMTNNATNNPWFAVIWYKDLRQIRIYRYGRESDAEPSGKSQQLAETAVNTWHALSVTYDDVLKTLYVNLDGVETATDCPQGLPLSDGFQFGSLHGGVNPWGWGWTYGYGVRMDNFCVWQSALTKAQCDTLATPCSGYAFIADTASQETDPILTQLRTGTMKKLSEMVAEDGPAKLMLAQDVVQPVSTASENTVAIELYDAGTLDVAAESAKLPKVDMKSANASLKIRKNLDDAVGELTHTAEAWLVMEGGTTEAPLLAAAEKTGKLRIAAGSFVEVYRNGDNFKYTIEGMDTSSKLYLTGSQGWGGSAESSFKNLTMIVPSTRPANRGETSIFYLSPGHVTNVVLQVEGQVKGDGHGTATDATTLAGLTGTGTFNPNGQTFKLAVPAESVNTFDGTLAGNGQLDILSGTFALKNNKSTYEGKVVIAADATLDISAEGARLVKTGWYKNADTLIIRGTLKTRNWNYGSNNTLAELGHNHDQVKIDGGRVEFTESVTGGNRAFTVTANGATLVLPDGAVYDKPYKDSSELASIVSSGTVRLEVANPETDKATFKIGDAMAGTVTVGKGVTLKAPGTFATLTADEGATLDITGNLSVGTLTPPTGGKINVVGTEGATVTFTSEGADAATEVAKLAPAAGMVFETADNRATLKVDTNAFTGLTGTVTPAQATVLAQAAQAAGVKPNAEGKITVTLTEKGAGIPNASVEQITAALEIFSGVASVDANDPSVLKVAYNFGITAMSFANDTLTLTAKVENDSASAAFAEGVTVKLIAIDGNIESDVTTTTSTFDAGRQAVVFTLNDISTVTSRLLKVKAVK